MSETVGYIIIFSFGTIATTNIALNAQHARYKINHRLRVGKWHSLVSGTRVAFSKHCFAIHGAGSLVPRFQGMALQFMKQGHRALGARFPRSYLPYACTRERGFSKTAHYLPLDPVFYFP